jgi:hypothetical protein
LQKAYWSFLISLLSSLRDLTPIVVVIACFQLLVIKQPFPDFFEMMSGIALVVLGLTFFIYGLELGLFPIGERMAHALASKGNVWWLIVFAFALGFGTAIAEPALIAVAAKAATVMAEGGVIQSGSEEIKQYAQGLRLTVALSVGFAIVLGAFRIIKGWPIQYLLIAGYLCIVVLTLLAPPEIIGIAYDVGGVTTSTITVPLVAALGVGLASCIHGRNPMLDGFGLIAFAALAPIIFVLFYGLVM